MEMYNVGPDELDQYALADLTYVGTRDFAWCVYWYYHPGYEGEGEAVALHKDGRVFVKNLGHCSCYGPMDGGLESGKAMTVEEFLTETDDIHDYDARPELKAKVRELLAAV
jgi:hypothetical protein